MPNQKLCKICKAPLISLPSMNKRICSNGKCATTYDWKLKPQQKSLLIEGLKGEEK